MSGSTDALSRKISGAKDLQNVVRSMKALAASSIGQYEKAVASLDDYYRTLELGLSACLRNAGVLPVAHPNHKAHPSPIGAVVFGSDQGLVGGFNEVLTEFTNQTLDALPGTVKRVWPIGERVRAIMLETGVDCGAPLSVPGSINAITSLIGQLLIEIESAVEKGEVAEVYIFHNQPRTGSLYEPVSKRLLPLDEAWRGKLLAIPWPTKCLPEVLEGVSPALHALLQGYFFVLLFQACAESLASENASRLAAMQRAEKNIEGMVDTLSRTLHRKRQESIDEELFDVISGFEALSDQKASAAVQKRNA